MVGWNKEKPQLIPVTFPKRHSPIAKIYGFDAPHDRGGYIAAGTEWEECPNCHKMTLAEELHWIGGLGYIKTKVCDAGCGVNGKNYWESKR